MQNFVQSRLRGQNQARKLSDCSLSLVPGEVRFVPDRPVCDADDRRDGELSAAFW